MAGMGEPDLRVVVQRPLPDAVAGGLADVGVVYELVDGGGGECLGHELVEPNWGG
jgi:hypothetical protein